MTAICPSSGTSSVIVGRPQQLIYLDNLLGFATIPAGMAWAIPFLAYLGVLTYDLPTLCATDPPGFTAFTLAESIAFSTLSFTADFWSCLAKLKDWGATLAWYANCKCDSIGPLAQPAGPAAPANAPAAAPIQQNSCFTITRSVTGFLFGGYTRMPSVPEGEGPATAYTRLPVTADYVTITTKNLPLGASPDSATLDYLFSNDSYAQVGASGFISVASGATTITSLAIPVGATHIYIDVFHAGSANSTNRLVSTCVFHCPGIDSCPTDPTIALQLTEILKLVRLIQRQDVPFSYLTGTVHAGLTGNGELAVQGILGLSVLLTTLPNYYGTQAGDPTQVFDTGYVTVGTSDGWLRSERIDHNPKLLLGIEGSVTKIGYSLSPNIVATITELVREQ